MIVNLKLHRLHMRIQSEIKCDSHVLQYVQHNAQKELIGKMNRIYWDMEKELIKKEWEAKMTKWDITPRIYSTEENVF